MAPVDGRMKNGPFSIGTSLPLPEARPTPRIPDPFRNIDIEGVSHINAVDHDDRKLFCHFRFLSGCLEIGAGPLKELKEFRSFQRYRDREILRFMKLLPVAVIPELNRLEAAFPNVILLKIGF